jgi:secondary thiamine-phosphate synthase enzyme
MRVHHGMITVRSKGSGTYEVTDAIAAELQKAGVQTGLLTVFCQHTSCSLVIMENASPEARRDLEDFLDRLVPPDPSFEHNLEGPDDMPSHIKMALTRTSETIPVQEGHLALGTWQGVYLWEHRKTPHTRSLTVTVMGL